MAALLAATPAVVTAQAVRDGDWRAYGRTVGGARHAPLADIRPDNVASLEVAWRFRTGEGAPAFATRRETRFEATPLAIDGILYLSTPLGRTFALDGTTGAVRWSFDPKVDRTRNWGDFANRGVAWWEDRRARRGTSCARRVLTVAIDARLTALDADTGLPCPGFGRGGTIDLRHGLRNAPFEIEEYQETSPPAVIGDVIVIGSAIADNNRFDAASGEVRGFDARTGRLLWTWDPVPQDPRDPDYDSWSGTDAHHSGAANVWSGIVGDPALGHVYLPTTSPSPDYFGGRRLGDNRNANSVVALDARTGRRIWAFQTVHHDLWDYDNAAPPALVTLRRNGRSVPALLQATKTGQLFVLDRRNGTPIFPVEERSVPASDVPGEVAARTQPFSSGLPALSPGALPADPFGHLAPADRAWCQARLAPLRNEGPFTPPSLQGSLVMPSNIGGVAWGGLSFDPVRGIVVIPTNRVAAIVQLFPSAAVKAPDEDGNRVGLETTRMRGTPFTMRRELFFTPGGLPCTPPPYGSLHAIDLNRGKTVWNVPLGGMAGAPEGGALLLGGPITTAGGVTFIGAATDGKFRALETATGRLLWTFTLPGWARSVPMTYRARDGRQMVAVAAGISKDGQDAELVVFALPAIASSGPGR